MSGAWTVRHWRVTPRQCGWRLAVLCLALLGAGDRATAQVCEGAWLPGEGVAGVDGPVYATLVLPDGDVIVGGYFANAGDAPVSNIARYRPATGEWFALGPGFNSIVRALARLPNGDVVAGGAFTRSGLAEVVRIARWNGTAWLQLGTSFDGPVDALAVMPNGDLIAGGSFFYTLLGTEVTNVARWDGYTWSGMYDLSAFSFLQGGVSALLVLPNGELIAAGSFIADFSQTYNRIARWNGSSWAPLGSGIGGPSGTTNVSALARLPNGDIVAGGSFASAGSGAAQNAAVWNGASWSSLGAGIPGAVRALHVQPSGQLYAAGFFPPDPLTSDWFGITRWNGATWTPTGVVAGGVNRPFGDVFALGTLPNGELIAGGDSSFIESTVSGLARWSETTQAWLATAVGGFNLDVRAIATLANGDVVAAGVFTQVAGTAVNRIARWNGSAWLALGAGIDGPVAAIARLPNGDLVAGGLFTSAGGVAASNLAVWNGSSWSPLGGGVNGEVTALAVFDGQLAVGGAFSSAGGTSSQNVAVWNGTAWSTAFAVGVNGRVNDIEPFVGGFYVSGAFTTAGAFPADQIASWGPSPGWYPQASSVVGSVFAVTSSPTLGLIAAGNFSSIGGVPARNVARNFGLGWVAMSLSIGMPSPSDRVSALAVHPSGGVVAGGYFSTSPTSFVNSIARWNGSNWVDLAGGVDNAVTALHVLTDGTLAVGGSFRHTEGGVSAHFAQFEFAGGSDADGDGADDVCDNCPYTANASQTDSGGLGTNGPDGIGDACQCGDASGDGRVLGSDVYVIRTGLAGVSGALLAPDRCSATGPVDPGLTAAGTRVDCNVADATVIQRALSGLAPGVAQVCEAALP